MTDGLEKKLQALADVRDAQHRLADAGLASEGGINDDGLQMLADLLAVLTFQADTPAAGPAERTMSAACRASLSALGDLYVELGSGEPSPAQTIKLLAKATRIAREAD